MVTTKKLALIFVLAALAHAWVLPLGFRGDDFGLLSSPFVVGNEGLTLQWLAQLLPVSAFAYRVVAVFLWAGLSVLIARTTAHLAGPELGPNAGLLTGLLVALSAGASGTLTTVIGMGTLLAAFFMLLGFELLQSAHTFEARRTPRRALGAAFILLGALSHPIALLLPLIMVGLLVFPFRQRELTRTEARPAIAILFVLFIAGVVLQMTFDTAGRGVQTPAELIGPGALPKSVLLQVGLQAFAPWSRAQVFADLGPMLGAWLTHAQIFIAFGAVLVLGFFLLRGTRRAILVTILLGALFSAAACILPAGAILDFPNDVAPTRPETLLPLLVLAGGLGLIGAAAIGRFRETKAVVLPVLLGVLMLASTIDSTVHVARTEARAGVWRGENIAQIKDTVRSAIEEGPGGKNTLTLVLAPPLNVGGIAGFGHDLGLALAPPFQNSEIEVISSSDEAHLLSLLNSHRRADPSFSRKAIQLLQPSTRMSNEEMIEIVLGASSPIPVSLYPLPKYQTTTPLRLGWQAPLAAGESPVGLAPDPASISELPSATEPAPPTPKPTAAWRFTPAVPAHALSAVSITIPPEGLRGALRLHLSNSLEPSPRIYPIHFAPRSTGSVDIQHIVNLKLSLLDHLAAPLRFLSWEPAEGVPPSAPNLAPTLLEWQHSPSLLEPGTDFVLDLSENAQPPKLHITLPATTITPEFCDLEMRLFIPRLILEAKPGELNSGSSSIEVTARARPSSPGKGELFATPTMLGPTDATGAPKPSLVAPFATYLNKGLRQALIREDAATGLLHMRVHLRGLSGMDLGTTPWQSAHFTTKSKEPVK
ncbi:MAG: hypothetical protein ACI8Q9_000345 [Planctomycetota bacterium]|jgi:hypothetical protein